MPLTLPNRPDLETCHEEDLGNHDKHDDVAFQHLDQFD